jgi:V/A-type H+-transporting ATPase subunit K
MKNTRKVFTKRLALSVTVTILVISLLFFVGIANIFAQAEATQGQTSAEQSAKGEVTKYALIAAALAFGFGAIAAGIAVGNVGSAAMGAIGEKPEIAGQAIVFVALAEGLAVFGMIIAILILGRA